MQAVPKPAACALALALSAGVVCAFPIEVRWAGAQSADKVNALGAPDGVTSPINLNESVTFSQFGGLGASPLTTLDLSFLLSADFGIADQADFIVFECNGQPGLGFEDSTWVFSDGVNTETYTADTAWFFSTIGIGAYESFFGLDTGCNGDIPALLFNLQAVDPASPDFTVTVTGANGEPGSPDPDAMGVIQLAPCPQDLDGSGAIDSADLNILLGGFGCVGVSCCPGDVNADGATNSTDLNLLLAAFGQPCS